jgi:hypothetical protein
VWDSAAGTWDSNANHFDSAEPSGVDSKSSRCTEDVSVREDRSVTTSSGKSSNQKAAVRSRDWSDVRNLEPVDVL